MDRRRMTAKATLAAAFALALGAAAPALVQAADDAPAATVMLSYSRPIAAQGVKSPAARFGLKLGRTDGLYVSGSPQSQLVDMSLNDQGEDLSFAIRGIDAAKLVAAFNATEGATGEASSSPFFGQILLFGTIGAIAAIALFAESDGSSPSTTTTTGGGTTTGTVTG